MAPPSYVSGEPILDIFYILFNGIAEVPLFSSPVLGILILAGVILHSRKAGFMMAIAGLIGAGTAMMLGADYELVTFGLFGYNSILTGMAFWSGPFVKTNRTTFFMSIFGASLTAVSWMFLTHLMGDMFVQGGEGWAIPSFTSSFVFTTWAMMFASQRFGRDIWPAPAEPPKTTTISGSSNALTEQTLQYKWTAAEFMRATLRGVSQVTFVGDWRTGIFWVVGLTLSFELAPMVADQTDRPWWANAYTNQWDEFSPLYLAGGMAMLGSAIGAAQSILFKLPTEEVRMGLHGFNQVLVMIAMTSFIPLTPQGFLMAIFATVACGFVMPGLQKLLSPWGIPPLTAPFVFTTWAFMLALSGFDYIPAGIGWAKP